MIVLDASAIAALLNSEEACEDVAARMVKDRMRCITPMSRLEAVMALAHRYRDPARLLEHVLQQESVALFATDRAQADWARHAFITYGKGRHPAQLNLGDCFSYAAARALDAPPL